MLPVGGVVAGCGGVGCVCGVGMPLWLCLVGAAAGVSLCSRGAVRWDCVCACLCASGFAHGVWWCVRVARFVSGGVFYYVRRGVQCGCLFVGCGVLRRVLLVCCSLFCLSAIACCAFREARLRLL